MSARWCTHAPPLTIPSTLNSHTKETSGTSSAALTVAFQTALLFPKLEFGQMNGMM
jgi:hypothetical protein